MEGRHWATAALPSDSAKENGTCAYSSLDEDNKVPQDQPQLAGRSSIGGSRRQRFLLFPASHYKCRLSHFCHAEDNVG